MTATMPSPLRIRARALIALAVATVVAVTATTAAEAATPLPAAAPKTAVTGAFSSPDVLTGEIAWLRGNVKVNGKLVDYKKLTVERRLGGSGSWTAFATTATTKGGTYAYGFYPYVKYQYRLRVTGTSAVTGALSVTLKTGGRTLEEREATVAWRLGAVKSSIRDIAQGDLPSGADSGRYRLYERGTLVEVVTDSVPHTWFVFDRTATKYGQLDRWEGRLGVPLRDARCGLMEGGCLQRFAGGALYQNGASMSPGVYAAYGTSVETELLAVGYSQVGYEEPSWRVNKYTKWLGSKPAWCMTWVAWVSTAAGYSSYVPKSGSYESYLKTLKASGRLHYSGVPPTGAIVLFDWGSGTPSHTAYVTSRSGSYIYTLEGNTTDGTGDPQRGVYHRKRALSYVWAWYWPSDI